MFQKNLLQYLDEHPPKDENTHEAKTGLHDAKMDLLRATGDDAKKLGKRLSLQITSQTLIIFYLV
jgi:hypothetical protein